MVNNLQAENLRKLLRYENLNQTTFSKIVHIPEPTISNYLHGKQKISAAKAMQIHKHYSAYDLDFILGNSDFPNKQSKANYEAAKEIQVHQCVERLAMNRGFRVSSFGEFDPKNVDMDAWHENWPNVDRAGISYCERLENSNGEAIKLSAEQWDSFVDEVCSYVEMRISAMIERGAW